jgi:hypothetical protein
LPVSKAAKIMLERKKSQLVVVILTLTDPYLGNNRHIIVPKMFFWAPKTVAFVPRYTYKLCYRGIVLRNHATGLKQGRI